jgi:putative transposase
MSRLTFKYRLYPNRQQHERLQATLELCRELYNAGLQERRDAWSSHRQGIGYRAQANQLRDIKTVRDDLAAVHSQVLQDVLRRLDQTFQSFRGRLSKSVHDAGWAAFLAKLAYKAECAGRQLVAVDARGTSQRCPCGQPNRKRLSNREHVCGECGLVTTRDHGAAMEILRLGRSLQSLSAA